MTKKKVQNDKNLFKMTHFDTCQNWQKCDQNNYKLGQNDNILFNMTKNPAQIDIFI